MRDSLEHHEVGAAAGFAIRDDLGTSGPHRGCNLRTPRVAGIDDSNPIGFEPLIEESYLRLEVGVHRWVIVEMVLGKIRKTSCVKRDACEALLIERVARSLHRKMRDAVHSLQLDR